MPYPSASDAGTADVASVRDTVVAAMPVGAEGLYTAGLEHVAVAVAAEEV